MGIDTRAIDRELKSARLERATMFGRNQAQAIKLTGSLSASARTHDEHEGSPVDKLFEDGFLENLDPTQKAQQDKVKADIKQAAKESHKVKAYAQEQYQAAGKNAQALAAQLIIDLDKEALQFLKRKNPQAADFANLSPEEFEANIDKILADPDQLPYIMKDVLTADMEAKRKELQKDPEALAELEKKEQALTPIFNALSALDNNGSHEEMFDAIDTMNKSQMTSRTKKLVKNYMNSLVEIGKAQQHHLGITLQNENSFLAINGINPRVDRKEFRRLYSRMGGMIADRNGAITGAGQVFNFNEAEIVHAGSPYEYKLGEDSDLEVRRLVSRLLQPAQNRTYTGVALNEDNPSPRFVYVDSDVPIVGELPFDDAVV